MSSVPADILPLNFEQTSSLQSAVSGLTPDQLRWVSGYAAGLAAAGAERVPVANGAGPAVATMSDSTQKLTVLFGSQTGNGEQIALNLVDDAIAQGYSARAISLADYKPSNLKRETLLTFVISTHGEGDPPDDAEIFHEFLMSGKAPKLTGVKFSVLALGDSSYVNFCQTGREVDARLEALGAERLAPTIECDLDYEEPAAAWGSTVIDGLSDVLAHTLDRVDTPSPPTLRAVAATVASSESVYNKSNPFPAEVLVNQKITGGNSSKDVRHIELSLEGSGLHYEPGDSLAVVAKNPPQLVDELLQALGFAGESPVTVKDQAVTLVEALEALLEITAVNLTFLRAWAAIADNDHLSSLFDEDRSTQLSEFVETHQIIDVVRQYPASVDAEEFVSMLRRLSPRSYSISSSMDANPDEVHITVAAVRYSAFDRDHWGAASTLLADRIAEGEKVRVFIDKNSRFRLPAADVPIIMIGPGTGIAPFRAFIEHRVETNAGGENWLFFGDRNADSDFLYQLEWQRYLKQGQLHRLSVAFSRDQRTKIYVQDRIREQGAELYRWIERGAAIYVCGDAKHMADDVNDALLEVLTEHGQLDAELALQRLKDLRAAGLYQRDVY